MTDKNGLIYMRARYYSPDMRRFVNSDIVAGQISNAVTLNRFAYANGNPVSFVDPFGLSADNRRSDGSDLKDVWNSFLQIVGEAFGWTYEQFQHLVESGAIILDDLKADLGNFNWENTDYESVYEAKYISAYKGTLVIRHSSDFLTSWAAGVIFLNHNMDKDVNPRISDEYRQQALDHEYGHILQEEEMGVKNYLFYVALPSVIYNLISRNSTSLGEVYYDMPWEYGADSRGGVDREHSFWSETVHDIYNFFVKASSFFSGLF